MVPLPDSNLEQKQKHSAILVTASPSECAVLASRLLPIFEKSSVSHRSLNLSKRTSGWLIACWPIFIFVLNRGRGNTRQMKTKPEKNWKTSFLTDLAQNLASYMKRAQKMSLSHNVSSKALPSNLKCISPSNKWENYSADSILFLSYKKKKNYPPLQFQLQYCPSDPIFLGNENKCVTVYASDNRTVV